MTASWILYQCSHSNEECEYWERILLPMGVKLTTSAPESYDHSASSSIKFSFTVQKPKPYYKPNGFKTRHPVWKYTNPSSRTFITKRVFSFFFGMQNSTLRCNICLRAHLLLNWLHISVGWLTLYLLHNVHYLLTPSMNILIKLPKFQEVLTIYLTLTLKISNPAISKIPMNEAPCLFVLSSDLLILVTSHLNRRS